MTGLELCWAAESRLWSDWLGLGRIQNNSHWLPLLDFELDLDLYTLYSTPQRLGFPAWLLNLFSLPHSSKLFLFMLYFLSSTCSLPLILQGFTATLYRSLLLCVAGSTTGCFYIFWSNNKRNMWVRYSIRKSNQSIKTRVVPIWSSDRYRRR